MIDIPIQMLAGEVTRTLDQSWFAERHVQRSPTIRLFGAVGL